MYVYVIISSKKEGGERGAAREKEITTTEKPRRHATPVLCARGGFCCVRRAERTDGSAPYKYIPKQKSW